MKKLRWGVIGIGGIASRKVVPEIQEHAARSEVVAVCGRDADRTKELASKLGIDSFCTSEDELLKSSDVDAVYIATPNNQHKIQAVAAARAGKHILCEKPLATSVSDAQEMARAARDAGVTLGVAYMMRFHSLHRKARELVRSGQLGTPVYGRAQLSCWYPKMEGAWRQILSEGGGGSLADLGSHCMDLLEFVFESPVREVCSFQATLAQDYSVEDSAVALLRFENGALGTVDCCFSVPDDSSRNRLEIYGSAGSLLAEGTIGQSPLGRMTACFSPQTDYDANQSRQTQQGTVEIHESPTPMYAAEFDHFAAAVLDEKPLEISEEEGLRSMRLLEACYRSARESTVVKLS
ncbi:MAG: Gfo/Idh/MocA family oxidoreductase [Armatimonadetes bacterium]|nr:Gfo/Idh/MocA family oxidoreductase [Armatimonadota bacterium]